MKTSNRWLVVLKNKQGAVEKQFKLSYGQEVVDFYRAWRDGRKIACDKWGREFVLGHRINLFVDQFIIQ